MIFEHNNNTSNITKIIPLFRTPIIKKIKRDEIISKYNLVGNQEIQSNLINTSAKNRRKIRKFKQNSVLHSVLSKGNNILGLYIKGLNLYKNHLNSYLSKNNHKDLILHIKKDLINNNYYLLNLRLSNILHKINKYQKILFIKKNVKQIVKFTQSSPFLFLKKTAAQSLFPVESKYIRIINIRAINKFKFSDLDLSQKVFIKKLLNLLKQATSSTNPNLFGEEQVSQSKELKIIIKLINNIHKKSVLNIKNKKSKSSKNLKLIKINNYQRILKLLEIIVSCLITINMLNNKILLKRNKIKLLKFINKYNQNKLTNSSNSSINNLQLTVNSNLSNNASFYGSVGASTAKDLVKSNIIKINQTINSINKHKEFNPKTNIIPSNNNFIPISYNKKLFPIINQYIKSISIFNLKSKGIIFDYSKIIGYNFNSNTNKLIQNAYKFLSASFYSMYSLISKPVFVITPDKVKIQLFYFLFIPNIFKYKILKIKNKNRKRFNRYFRIRNFSRLNYKFFSNKITYNKKKQKFFNKLAKISLINLFPNKFKYICIILSRLFKKPVELDLIRLHYPYYDSNILVNLLGIMINKIKIRVIFKKLFKTAIIKKLNYLPNKNKVFNLPSFLTGMNIKIAGRLLTQKVVPRKTIKTIRRGALAKGKINFLDVARFTNKNKRGSFSITISSAQIYN